MEHVLFIQKVKKDKKEDYIKYHKNCFPGVLKVLKDSGTEREIIWIEGETLIIYAMAEDFKKSMEGLKNKKEFNKWIELMTPLLAEIQDYSKDGEIKRLEKVFDLEEQLENR